MYRPGQRGTGHSSAIMRVVAMIDRDAFGRLLQDALSHLYDQPYLQTHPLATLFAVTTPTETDGHSLHRILLEAIQEMAPPPATPSHSPVWRKHRYLILRYLEGRTASEVTEDLAISERQSRRYHHEALEALSSILWGRFRNVHPQPQRTGLEASGDETSPQGGASGEPAVLENEVVALEAGQSLGPVSIGMTLNGVFSTAAPLAERRRIAMTLQASSDLPAARISRTVLRPALLEVLLTALDLPDAEAIAVEATTDAQEITLSFAVHRRADRPPVRHIESHRHGMAFRTCGSSRCSPAAVAGTRRSHHDRRRVRSALRDQGASTIGRAGDYPGRRR